MILVRLPNLAVLDVIGKDAAKIAQNLCTANIETIGPSRGREAFITDVRGKTLGHVCVFRTDKGLRLIGAGAHDTLGVPNQATAIAAHFDKYTLREQSVPEDRSTELAGIFVADELVPKLDGSIAALATDMPTVDLPFVSFQINQQSGTSISGDAYRVPWCSGVPVLLLVDQSQVDMLVDYLLAAGGIEASEAEFHRRRIENHFPWYGIDIDSSHLPQEADRNDKAISFNKGCYLGQETVARLDALGQVQKKLVTWRLTCDSMPPANTELRDGDRVVGRLTSVAKGHGDHQYIALGFARRSHFDSGCQAMGATEHGEAIEAVVSEYL
jgi:tRNA-modifying protein YgfZ